MSQINMFKDAWTKQPMDTITIDAFIDGIREGRWKHQVETVRQCIDKEQRDEAKKSVPSVTCSGTFTQRNQESMIKHSGYICIDVDVRVDRSTLCRDQYTYALFDSVSGNGVAILVKISPEKHRESFEYLQRYYFDQYGLVIDPKPRNIASLRFVSYDPHLYINPESKLSRHNIPKPKPTKTLPLVYTQDEIGTLVRSAQDKGVNIAESYEDYLNLSFSLAEELGESGRTYFHALCSMSAKYRHEQADRQYDIALKRESSGRKVTIGTFYHMLKQAGINLPKSDSSIITLAATAKKDGKDTKQIAELLVNSTKLNKSQADRIAQSVVERPDITLATLSADPEHLIETLIMFLKNKYPLKRNAITYKIEHSKNNQPIQEEDINDIYLHARAAFNTPNVTKDLVQSIIFSNQTPTYNPLEDFISKHTHVKPTGVIDALVSCVQTSTPHAANWIRKWLIGIHAAIDGHPVRSMLVFTGPQYNGKTEFFRRLLPTELKTYYAESKLDRGKDDELLMCQKLIVMDDEMGGKSKQDEKRLKELTSKETFSLRAPYRKDNMDYKRLAVLCGTSNPTEVITDPTGNTRILPVKVESIDFNKINTINRTELFMEAYHAYKSGETWLLDREEVNQLASVSDDFSSISYEKELILQFFQPYDGHGHCDWMTATEIKNEIEVNTKQQIRNMGRFGIELRKAMGDPKSRKRGSIPIKCYPVIKLGSNPPTTVEYSEPLKNQSLPF
jgi:predicted P-loop ATPase